MNDRQSKIINITRRWLGTPWVHNQAVIGIGVDCINFVWQVGKEAGFEIADMPRRYTRTATYNNIVNFLDKHFPRVEKQNLQPSDLICIEYAGYNNHLAFVTDRGMIHADSNERKVIEHPISDRFFNKITVAWRIVDG